jgi:hypothetical protein
MNWPRGPGKWNCDIAGHGGAMNYAQSRACSGFDCLFVQIKLFFCAWKFSKEDMFLTSIRKFGNIP